MYRKKCVVCVVDQISDFLTTPSGQTEKLLSMRKSPKQSHHPDTYLPGMFQSFAISMAHMGQIET